MTDDEKTKALQSMDDALFSLGEARGSYMAGELDECSDSLDDARSSIATAEDCVTAEMKKGRFKCSVCGREVTGLDWNYEIQECIKCTLGKRRVR